MRTNILLIGLLISGTMYSQVIKRDLPPKSFYRKAVISVYDKSPSYISKVEIKSDSISFNEFTEYNSGSEPIYTTLPFSSIDYLQVKQGNKGINGAIIGGLLACSIAICASIDEGPDFPQTLGITVTGATIGAVIGLLSHKKKKYFISY